MIEEGEIEMVPQNFGSLTSPVKKENILDGEMEEQDFVPDSMKQGECDLQTGDRERGNETWLEDVVLIENVPMDEWGQETHPSEIEEQKSWSEQEDERVNVVIGREKDYQSEEEQSGSKKKNGKSEMEASRSTKRVITQPLRLNL